MKLPKLSTVLSLLLSAVGVVLICLTRSAALSQDASALQTFLFSLSLILTAVGLVATIVTALPARKKADTHTLAMAALFSALCYIGFSYCKVDIPVGTEKTAFHLGNVFCVLASLFLGGFWGGMSGAVGMTIADLTSSYVTSAPKTFILKLGIGLITGLIAHKIFHISQDRQRKVPMPVATALSCAGGMAFNMIADPLVGYFYKMYVLGVPQKVAGIWAKIGALTTGVNALVALIAATLLYLALRPALKKARLLPHV